VGRAAGRGAAGPIEGFEGEPGTQRGFGSSFSKSEAGDAGEAVEAGKGREAGEAGEAGELAEPGEENAPVSTGSLVAGLGAAAFGAGAGAARGGARARRWPQAHASAPIRLYRSHRPQATPS
jgi:hypothetical protein